MKKVILLIIIVIAVILRLWHLDTNPALNADEAAIGYNAYSLIQTGKDEDGNPWPIHFQSFNDYKPGLYFYIVLPFVKVLGLNAWSVRLPNALLGVLTVLVVYYLVLELNLSRGSRITDHGSPASVSALMSAFFLAISPWHIHFSRGGWEVNVATFFITVGVWLFIKSLKKPKLLVISSTFFVLSLYTYHAARVVVPLLVLGLLIIYRKRILKSISHKALILNSLFVILLLLPLAKDFFGPAGFSRAAGVGLFADPGILARIDEQRGEHINYTGIPAKMLHNKMVNYSLAFLENWGKHFSGDFLFFNGDSIERNKVPEFGEMYLIDILFLFAGLIAILRTKKAWKPILLWLFVAPAGAALTFQSPHALRAENMVIPLVIISAFGLIYLSQRLHELVKSKKVLNFVFALFVLAMALSFTRYLHQYYMHMSKTYPFSSQYGMDELVSYVQKEGGKYDHIVVSDRYDQPYILFLFYLKYPPEKFQLEHTLTSRNVYGFSTVGSFSKYIFKGIEFDEDKKNFPKSLIIGTDSEIPDEANIVAEIYGINGYKYFQIVAN